MNAGSADLEVALHPIDAYRYAVDLRFSPVDGQTDEWLEGETRIDFEELRAEALDDGKFGALLAQALFPTEELLSAYRKARTAAETQDAALRLRLLMGQDALELQTIAWERILDPVSKVPLLTQSWVHFSRYLASSDWRPIRPRARSNLQAVVVVANPVDLADYDLPPIDVDLELPHVDLGLEGTKVTRLVTPQDATLDNIVEQLVSGIDILYIACHGRFDPRAGSSFLFLCDQTGKVARVDGVHLANRIAQLFLRPRLVVLAACGSAGEAPTRSDSASGQVGALGPRIARAGVPAVVAMQGPLSTVSAQQFMPVFFGELRKSGLVDRAMSVARGAIQGQPDWWKPALFMRLRSGALAYEPRLTTAPGTDSSAVDTLWRRMVASIGAGRCTPILGPGLTDYLSGGRAEISRRWARDERIPLPQSELDSLHQVAQFVATETDTFTASTTYLDQVRSAIQDDQSSSERLLVGARLTGWGRDLAEGPLGDRASALHVNEQIRLIAGVRMRSDELEPHRVLARLRLPIYLVAGFTDLMADALRLEGRTPRVAIYPWKGRDECGSWIPSSIDIFGSGEQSKPRVVDPSRPSRRRWSPSVEEPLVLHLFGRLDVEDSMVLTEDDYFDYLLGMDRKHQTFSSMVGPQLVSSALLFLGFKSEDWGFRVMFRSIIAREGADLRERFSHVAVQLAPDDAASFSPTRLQSYLRRYFEKKNVSVYMGGVEDFVQELSERMRPGGATEAAR